MCHHEFDFLFTTQGVERFDIFRTKLHEGLGPVASEVKAVEQQHFRFQLVFRFFALSTDYRVSA